MIGLCGQLPILVRIFWRSDIFTSASITTYYSLHIQDTGVPQGRRILAATLFGVKGNDIAASVKKGVYCGRLCSLLLRLQMKPQLEALNMDLDVLADTKVPEHPQWLLRKRSVVLQFIKLRKSGTNPLDSKDSMERFTSP